MLYPKKIQCPVCKKDRLVDYRYIWRVKKGTLTTRCLGCSRFKKGETNPGGFKKGIVPWNKGKKIKLSDKAKANIRKANKNRVEDKNGMWKGDKVGYFGLHLWKVARSGNPKECEHCGVAGRKNGRNWSIHWANKSGKYLRDLSDWIGLCRRCHSKYDNKIINAKN